jgi:hypothetical protein
MKWLKILLIILPGIYELLQKLHDLWDPPAPQPKT